MAHERRQLRKGLLWLILDLAGDVRVYNVDNRVVNAESPLVLV